MLKRGMCLKYPYFFITIDQPLAERTSDRCPFPEFSLAQVLKGLGVSIQWHTKPLPNLFTSENDLIGCD
uniref:Expressed protein n=1 Tax=Echinococcus granulosus TaxID=6210 RepID=A0A068WMI7_ECHGR|nr:expressed protein [Echinococcus granulosus]